ncbi:MAG TPA: lysozyme inhibitor LprI family protein [Solirubrobacteraceae bacterium]|jgi:uncharacterized protein YecT (DUF1311 family)
MVRTVMTTAAVLAVAAGWTVAHASSGPRPADTYSRCVKRAVSTLDTEKCQTAELKRLKTAISTALAKEKRALGHGAALDRAQARWRRFRDSYCGYLFTVYRQGTIAPVVAGDCRIRLTRERIRDVAQDARGLGG